MLIILKAFLKSFGLFLSVKLKSKVSACKNYVTVITPTNFFVVVVVVVVDVVVVVVAVAVVSVFFFVFVFFFIKKYFIIYF